MKQLVRIRNIERATKFHVEYIDNVLDNQKVEVREFASSKSLQQWVDRNDLLGFLTVNRRALIDDMWEPYTVIGKKAITLHTLKNVVRQLEDDSLKYSESKN